MKSVLIPLFAVLALAAHAVTYRQASQAWVNMQLQILESKMSANIQQAVLSTNDIEQIAQGCANQSIGEATAIATALALTSIGIDTNGTPYYAVAFVSPAYTNIVSVNDTLWRQSGGTYTNATATLTEGAVTNTLTASGVTLYSVGGSYSSSGTEGFVYATKLYR